MENQCGVKHLYKAEPDTCESGGWAYEEHSQSTKTK